MEIQAEENRAYKKVEGFKQQLAELEEIVEEAEGDEKGESPIKDCQEKIKKKEEKQARCCTNQEGRG